MLTKTDINIIKDLLKTFATKDDLKNFATKDDLKNFATKDDLKGLATQRDLAGLARGREIDDLKFTFLDNLTKWKSELFDKIDKVLGRVTTAEDENKILRARGELEPRLKKLEDIHPGNRHTATA